LNHYKSKFTDLSIAVLLGQSTFLHLNGLILLSIQTKDEQNILVMKTLKKLRTQLIHIKEILIELKSDDKFCSYGYDYSILSNIKHVAESNKTLTNISDWLKLTMLLCDKGLKQTLEKLISKVEVLASAHIKISNCLDNNPDKNDLSILENDLRRTASKWNALYSFTESLILIHDSVPTKMIGAKAKTGPYLVWVNSQPLTKRRGAGHKNLSALNLVSRVD